MGQHTLQLLLALTVILPIAICDLASLTDTFELKATAEDVACTSQGAFSGLSGDGAGGLDKTNGLFGLSAERLAGEAISGKELGGLTGKDLGVGLGTGLGRGGEIAGGLGKGFLGGGGLGGGLSKGLGGTEGIGGKLGKGLGSEGGLGAGIGKGLGGGLGIGLGGGGGKELFGVLGKGLGGAGEGGIGGVFGKGLVDGVGKGLGGGLGKGLGGGLGKALGVGGGKGYIGVLGKGIGEGVGSLNGGIGKGITGALGAGLVGDKGSGSGGGFSSVFNKGSSMAGALSPALRGVATGGVKVGNDILKAGTSVAKQSVNEYTGAGKSGAAGLVAKVGFKAVETSVIGGVTAALGPAGGVAAKVGMTVGNKVYKIAKPIVKATVKEGIGMAGSAIKGGGSAVGEYITQAGSEKEGVKAAFHSTTGSVVKKGSQLAGGTLSKLGSHDYTGVESVVGGVCEKGIQVAGTGVKEGSKAAVNLVGKAKEKVGVHLESGAVFSSGKDKVSGILRKSTEVGNQVTAKVSSVFKVDEAKSKLSLIKSKTSECKDQAFGFLKMGDLKSKLSLKESKTTEGLGIAAKGAGSEALGEASASSVTLSSGHQSQTSESFSVGGAVAESAACVSATTFDGADISLAVL